MEKVVDSRSRILTALNHQEPDKLPIDLGGMGSTGITAIAYNSLKSYLGIQEGETRIFDIIQQLAIVEPLILNRFKVDVLPIYRAPLGLDFTKPKWKSWQLADGSQGYVPEGFCPMKNTNGERIFHDSGINITYKMPVNGLYFDEVSHPLADATSVAEIESQFYLDDISEDEISWMQAEAKYFFTHSEKALMAHYRGSILEVAQSLRGWERFMMDLILEPKLAEALIRKITDHHLFNLSRFLDALKDFTQIIVMGDDLGNQKGLQMSPALYRKMIKPYHQQIYEYVKNNSNFFLFLHSCGSIYPLIPDLIEIGVDILNPVQITASEMNPKKLKEEFGNDIVFWGGGADTQGVLTFGSPEQVRNHVRELIDIFAPGGGFVFNQVHNIQANVPPENIVAMFDTAVDYGGY
jgi:uroporphyrinogen decarboxylase